MHWIRRGLKIPCCRWLACVVSIAWVSATAGADDNVQGVPDLFLVVIDVSGSMKGPLPAPVQPTLTTSSRLQEVVRRLDMLAKVLPDGVRVIVTEFDSSARQLADITLNAPADREALRTSLQSVTSRDGSTHLWRTARDQLRMATQMLAKHPEQRARLLLYTDGEDMEKAPGLDHASIISEFGDQLSAHVQWDWVTLGFDVRPEVKKPLQDAGVRFVSAIEPADLIPLQAEFRLSGTEVLVGQAVRLEDRSPSVDVVERIVDWGDGSSPTSGPPFTKSYTVDGEFTVVLTIRDNRQRTSSARATVKVSKPTAPTAMLSINRTQVAWNEEVIATDTSPGKETTRVWRLDGREVDGANSTMAFRLNTPGNHRVELIVRDTYGQESRATSDFVVSPAPLKKPVIRLSSQRPELRQALWAADETAAGDVQWQWMVDNRVAGTAAAMQLPTDVAGQHSVKLILSDRHGQKAESVVSYDVILPAAPKAAFAVPSQQLRPGDSVFLLNESANANRFQWVVPGQTPSTAVHGLLKVQDYGVVSVTLTATDEHGRSDMISKQIDIPRPAAPLADFIAPEFCVPQSMYQLIDASSGEIQHLEWVLNGEAVAGGRILEFGPNSPGEYTVTRIARGPGGENSCSKTITVKPFDPPVAALTFGSTHPCTGDEVLVTDISTGLVDRVVIELERNASGNGGSTEQTSQVLLDAEKTADTPSVLKLDCSESGAFTLRLTVYGPGGTDQAEHSFMVAERYLPVTADLTPQSYTGIAPATVCFQIRFGGTASRLMFDAGDGTAIRDVTHEGAIRHTYTKGHWRPCLKVYGVDDFAPATAVADIIIQTPPPPWWQSLWWQILMALVAVAAARNFMTRRHSAALERESLLLQGELIVRGLTDPALMQRTSFEGLAMEESVTLSSELTLRLAAVSSETGPEYRASLLSGGMCISELRLEPGEEAEIGGLAVTYYP